MSAALAARSAAEPASGPPHTEVAAQLADALRRLHAVGAEPVAVYGAGRLAAAVLESRPELAARITLALDDDESRHGGTLAGIPIVAPEEAVRRSHKGVIVFAREKAARAILARRGGLRAAGVDIRVVPSCFAHKHWDQGLIDHADAERARELGRPFPYEHPWPPVDHRPWSALLAPLQEQLARGGDLLEIGPGGGLYSELMIPSARSFTAVDFSERLLVEVLERRLAPSLGKLRLVHDETSTLPSVTDASIDAAFSVDCFVHVKIDATYCWLKALRRVVRPGGVILLHFKTWGDAEMERFDRTTRAPAVYRSTHFTHPEELRACAERLGLGFEALPPTDSSYYARFTVPAR